MARVPRVPHASAGCAICCVALHTARRMYQIDATSTLRITRTGARRRLGVVVGRTVIALGITSLITDVSSEMVNTVLPIYLIFTLGLTPVQFGFIDGIYQGVTAFVRLIGGVAADRWNRHKEIAASGYGLSAICKIALVAAGASWPALASIVALDRMGKGVRTAPRDALISLTTAPDDHGIAFGVHRAFDSAGALLGPLVALAILAAWPNRFDLVFVTSFAIAIVGVGVLLLFVENIVATQRAMRSEQAAVPADMLDLMQVRSLARIVTTATVLSAVTISDAFLYLLLQRQDGFNPVMFPLLYVGTAGAFLLLAIPAGRLADVIGRRSIFLAGHVLLVPAYVLVMRASTGLAGVIGCVLLLGTYYAMTDGVLMALAGELCPDERRAAGMALVTTATSGARLVSPIVFGALWTWYGTSFVVRVYLGALLAALAAAAFMFQRDARRDSGVVVR